MYDNVSFMTSAPLVTNGTQNIPYPAGRDAGHYATGGHSAFLRGSQAALDLGSGFELTFGAANITFTYRGTTSIPANTQVSIQLNRIGADSRVANQATPAMPRVALGALAMFILGAPVAAAAAGLAALQAVAANAAAVLTTVGGVDLDVPRNVVAAWTGAAVMTVTGVDEYGRSVVESSASGVAFTGKKSFKRVTSITVSAAVTALTAGTGNVLGLPAVVEGFGYVIAELQDGVTAAAGTFVAADAAKATATTGDVRGTYVPAAAPNGSRKYVLAVASDNPANRGVAQFGG